MSLRARLTLAAAAAALTGACADLTPTRGLPPLPSLPPAGTEAARAALVLVDSSAGRATVAVLVETPGAALGAYQGTVRFDASGVHVERVTTPADGSHFTNVADAGVVRLAGFAPNGLAGGEVARLALRITDWTLLGTASVELEAAGSRDGERLTRGTQLLRGTYRSASLHSGR